ncbi:phenylalanine--tRNA ligase subunit alpha [Metallosphaera tengchongensis]|uniref:Phenylalanine--tRNA ligase alpha subunit n=1 Tax=Metallosphaera tengchongensis TaxID=1532350 RepID=A0A6N0NU83_9CREN|nr:phenylalanine--tRNA ligase subunit alpha [Metallosphaera tengchongensis]QKQ99714.1 phenylalanine--tRNA ligase subunit alpha [Metallosphaera tengchongensis]
MLSDSELKIISFLKSKKVATSDEISKETGLPLSTVFSNLALLESKGIVKVISDKKIQYISLTSEGESRLRDGMPEDKLLRLLNGNVGNLQELRSKMGSDFEIALGWAKRKGLVELNGEEIKPLVKDYSSPENTLLLKLRNGDSLNENEIQTLMKRKLVERKERRLVEVELTQDAVSKPQELYLTHEMLVSGSWRGKEFKPYNVEALPPFYPIGKSHYFRDFIEKVKDLMISLGFKEVVSDYVEMEFYNFDMLFQPQDHPAREIHDSFIVNGHGSLPNEELVRRVKDTHEKWWKYSWSEENAKRLVLRSQTTAVTARVLSKSPKNARVFTIGKVFRPDSIDATHLVEFHQMDGLVIEDEFTFRDLLSTLRDIFSGLGVKQIKFKPAYFPFTEPSVEVYGFVDPLGWVEMAGAGLLREEVTNPSGVYAPAGAWGIGIDRLAMLFLGVKDIRDLYSTNIEYLRSRRVV